MLEAVVRSFAPIEPLALRWQFPIWHVDGDADPTKLRGRLSKVEERQLDKDKQGRDAIMNALVKGPKTTRQLRGVLKAGKGRCDRLLDTLEADGAVEYEMATGQGGRQRMYRLAEETGT